MEPTTSTERRTERGRQVLIAAAAAGCAAAAFAALEITTRGAAADALAAVRLAGHSGRVPGWVLPLAGGALAGVSALAVAYLALGRRRALKVVLLTVLGLALGVPGLVVGYARGTIDVVSARTPDVAAAVGAAEEELDVAEAREPVTVLLIGSDKSGAGDPGRSDTQLLLRLDPETRSISMLSLPRDLLVNIPGYGAGKMNAAYSHGGPQLVVRTFKRLTGLEINHFIEVDFSGFWRVVNILGGVYVPVDRRYFVPESADHKSIDLQPGYQVLRGHDALDYVRFRHDEYGDFARMQRQQLFLRELQRQSGRWSGDWGRVLRLVRAVARETRSDLDSLSDLEPLVRLALEVDTSKVYAVHLEGATPTIGGVSYVTAGPGRIAAAVRRFLRPRQAPLEAAAGGVKRRSYRVVVHGAAGAAAEAAAGLRARGFRATEGVAGEGTGVAAVVYAPTRLKAQARAVAGMLWPSSVRLVARSPGARDGITVLLGSGYSGVRTPTAEDDGGREKLLAGRRTGWDAWRQLATRTPLSLRAPAAWPSGSEWRQFRAYTLTTVEGRRYPAAVAVAETPRHGAWTVQATRWTDAPAVRHPTVRRVADGRTYLLFYEGGSLHMVAWGEGGTLYWVTNTLDDQLSNDVLFGLARSCRPVR